MLRSVAIAAFLVPLCAGAVETVRIHMGDPNGETTVQGQGLAFGLDVEEGRFTPAPNGRSVVRVNAGRLEVDGAPWPAEALRFRSGEDALDAGVPTHTPIRANDFEVRGDIVVKVHRGRLRLINVIPMEDYLAAVLGGEMPRSFPEEALKAQAVAARTYALQKKLDALHQPFHLGSSVISQVYGGLEREDARTRAAVEATRGQVLTWELQPIEAYFHASCGGRTEDGQSALGRDLPYLQAVDCDCEKLPASRWETTVTADQLQRALGTRVEGGLTVQGRTRTGRATRVGAGSRRSLDAVSFRARLGYSTIKSLFFEVEPLRHGEAFHFKGRGYGHGAGMCQWGAKVMADKGHGYQQILQHYYPGTELQRLY